jgi:carbamoyl-phosphate synthase large subunit
MVTASDSTHSQHIPGNGRGRKFSDARKGRSILLLGSGALKIGEAGEFDYSGSQAIKALKEEGCRVILMNPNIATRQTNADFADDVYFLPLTPDFALKVLKKERPDSIVLSFGGQTALNCGVALWKRGILERFGVEVLGTPVAMVDATEDREKFNAHLQSIGVAVPRSIAVKSREEGLLAAGEIGYPVIVRGGFALGGAGSGWAGRSQELNDILSTILVTSPHALVEEDLTGWKEVEYEVVRDRADNVITVCNMENVDPMGIHTGESIVVAPSQTLSNSDYHLLRSVAQKVIRHFGIIGECNIQFALNPNPDPDPSPAYRVIEVNARLSRSSALASKATGYPLAFVAAKLVLGATLPELRNAITQVTSTDFEPALDYVAVKVPRWDLQKFRHVSEAVTSEMKSVGEVMGLGRTFEEALQKALRMVNIGVEGLFPEQLKFPHLQEELARVTPRRIFAVARALKEGWDGESVHAKTGIDRWFLDRIGACAGVLRELEWTRRSVLTTHLLREAKRHGFSDAHIAGIRGVEVETIRRQREKFGTLPVVKQIDTLGGEFPAKTNYMYFTYHGAESDVTFGEGTEATEGTEGAEVAGTSVPSVPLVPSVPSPKRVLVLGGGPYSIGSSVEFDWCCTEAVSELRSLGYEVAMLNSNPETVSTDYDECDHLFFDELTLERVLDVVSVFFPSGVVVSMGGQIPNSLAKRLRHAGVPILGTRAEDIDRSEDRHKFSALLDELAIDQPAWKEFTRVEEIKQFASTVGYPVIVRPSYVLSGAAMAVVHTQDDLQSYLDAATTVSVLAPVVISKFEEGAKEIDFDAVAQGGKLLLYALSEHIENAGVHSGDATLILPPQRLNLETFNRIKAIAKQIARALNISGPFNIQLLAKENRIKVIECNLRSSRSFPFASKVTNVNFARLATRALLGIAPTDTRYQTVDLDHVGVKAPQFSFSRLRGADPQLGIEMSSTGEVACFGATAEEALLLSMLAVGFRLPERSILLSVGRREDKIDMLGAFQTLNAMGFALYATTKTHEFLQAHRIPSVLLFRVSERRSPNIKEYLEGRRIDLVINIPKHYGADELTDGYIIRRIAVDRNIPIITNVQLGKRFMEALEKVKVEGIAVKPWSAFQQ